MDRRQKFIILIIGSVLLLGAVIWFFVWPLLQPVLPDVIKPQPPALDDPNPPTIQTGTETEGQQQEGSLDPFTINPKENPDAQRIIELSRRAGALSELVESGSNENSFSNYTDALLSVDASLAQKLRQMQASLRSAHPKDGERYITIARRLVEIPEHPSIIQNDTFEVQVQMQVQTQSGAESSTSYLQSIVTFERRGSEWVTADYEVEPFTP